MATTFSSLAVALAVYKVALLLCSLAMILLAERLCRRRGDAGAHAFALFAWNPLLIWEVSGQAHNDGLMLLCLIAFVALACAGRHARAFLAITAGFFAKFAVAPLVGLSLVERLRSRHRLEALILGLAFVAVGATLFAPYWVGADTFRGPYFAATCGIDHTTRSLVDLVLVVADRVGAPQPIRRAIYQVLASIGWAMLLALALRAIARTRAVDDVFRQGLSFLAVWQLVTPWYQAWYATWLLPLVLVVDDPGWQRFVSLFTVLELIQYGVPLDSATNVLIDAWAVVALVRMHRVQPALQAPIAV